MTEGELKVTHSLRCEIRCWKPYLRRVLTYFYASQRCEISGWKPVSRTCANVLLCEPKVYRMRDKRLETGISDVC